MADAVRSLTIVNEKPDLDALYTSKFNLHVAKSVKKGDEVTYNMVWKSIVLAPTISVTWQAIYGINWCASVPNDGAAIVLGGVWRQCDPVQVLDLDEKGSWKQSTEKPSPGSLKVGKNSYNTGTGNNGVHFIIGVQQAGAVPNTFGAVFVDLAETGHGMSAEYQPQEQLTWWYTTGIKTSTMISSITGPRGQGDFSAPDPDSGKYSKNSSYSFTKGEWTTTEP